MSSDRNTRSPGALPSGQEPDTAPTSAELPEGFDSTAEATSGDPFEAAFAMPPPPARVGAYRVGELVGRGAMGAVYRAEQENPRRTVALKLIRPGAATPEVLRRFDYEAHVLGLLQHPGIAQIYEAGMADSAAGPQPFFAMELIDGMPLRRYAEEHELAPEQRLELVARVCDAVAHAHQKGVIHRDLKPSNILVDRDGQPKVLDFGVARVADGDQQETMGTSVGQLIGTLPYMSPEQVSGSSADLDTRSDVYAIGVILHELLSGQLPVDTRDRPVAVAVRMIQEDDPARLSSVDRSYRGDIETIVGKALAKDRDRRYQTVSALAQDIRYFLADEPIAARPPSAWYQVTKFARRNRALVAGLVVAVVALAVGFAGTAYGLIEAQRARDLAESEAATSARVVDLLAELLGGADPYARQGPELTVRDLLDRGARRVASLEEEPLVQARLLETMGQAFENLGAYDEAEPLLVRALELREGAADREQRVEIAKTESALSQVYQGQGRFDEGVAVAEQALIALENNGEASAAERRYATANLVQLLLTRAEFDRAEEVIERRLAEPDGDGTGTRGLDDMYALRAMVRGRTQRLEEALADARRALELYDERESSNSLVRATLLSDQAVILAQMGRLDEAAPLLQQSLDINESWLDPDHPIFATTLHNLGSMKLDLGEYDEASGYLQRAVVSRETVFGPDHPAVTSSLNNLAKIHLQLGEYDQAEPLYERSVRIREQSLGPQHPALASTFHAMGDMYRLWGRYPESARSYERAIAIQEVNATPDLPAALRSLAEVLDELGQPEQAAAARARADTVERESEG